MRTLRILALVCTVFVLTLKTGAQNNNQPVLTKTNGSGELASPLKFLAPGTNITAGTNIHLDTNASGKLRINSTASGGGGVASNGNQFGASAELTLKAGARQTNANFHGAGTNHADYHVEGALVAADLQATGLLEDYALIADVGGAIANSVTTSTELGWLSGVTGPVQAQLDRTNFSALLVTNQLLYQPQHFTGAATTNQFDLALATHKAFTNRLTTNIVCQLTNVARGASVSTVLYGANGSVIASNYTVKFTATNGTGIYWLGGLGTNGNYDFAVPSNQVVFVSFFCDRATNVFAQWNTNLVNVP